MGSTRIRTSASPPRLERDHDRQRPTTRVSCRSESGIVLDSRGFPWSLGSTSALAADRSAAVAGSIILQPSKAPPQRRDVPCFDWMYSCAVACARTAGGGGEGALIFEQLLLHARPTVTGDTGFSISAHRRSHRCRRCPARIRPRESPAEQPDQNVLTSSQHIRLR